MAKSGAGAPGGVPALSIYIYMADVVKFSLGGQESALVMTNGK